jgi:chromosome partitioning protein
MNGNTDWQISGDTDMKIITLATQKGGATKTTLCRHLAVAAHLDGFRTAILDTDQQGGSRDWGATRLSRGYGPPEVYHELSPNEDHLKAALAAIKAKGTEIVFVDTPGSLNGPIALNASRAADHVLVPMRPTADDIKALPPFIAHLRREKVSFSVVVSAAVTNTSRPKTEALTYLEASKLPYLGAVIHQKSVIPETLISGQTVFEISGLTDAEQKSVDEFRAVYEWVRDKIALTHRVAA